VKYNKVLVLNDTSYEGHVGCTLVMREIKSICDKISSYTEFLDISRIRKAGSCEFKGKADLLIINGEGSFHHDSKAGIIIFEFVKIYKKTWGDVRVVLLNAAWFSNERSNSYLDLVDLACFRDEQSAHNAALYLKSAPMVCPDLAFFGALEVIGSGGKGGEPGFVFKQVGVSGDCSEFIAGGSWLSIFIGRNRFSTFKTQLNITDLYSPERIFRKISEHFHHRRYDTAEGYVSNMLDSRRLCTGRFHGVIIAIACNIDCRWVESNTPKIDASVSMFSDIVGANRSACKERSWSSLNEVDYIELVDKSNQYLKAFIDEV